ncbi:MAG: phytanoyl-CoA dioxygenase family protein [Pseudomonadales bacterium]|nr:phytanoyl-CoA dioxygenase family protein [Pseudomonadales bacterium]
MKQQQQQFIEQGYIVLESGLNTADMDLLEQSNTQLYRQAQTLLENAAQQQYSLSDYYKDAPDELIVVPEIDNPTKVCRYEYLRASNQAIREQLVPKLQEYIKGLTGVDFVLFKDKCNAKNPGGGAFEPHQDVIAYDKFKPNYHITVAIFLDESTHQNGCLHFAKNYRTDLAGKGVKSYKTPAGKLQVLPSDKGGSKNGNITEEICQQVNWQAILAKPGDIVIFDSYVPHYSNKNESEFPRRAMFFTFNAKADGDYYQAYYAMKHAEFDNPAFHIATPTAHSQTV